MPSTAVAVNKDHVVGKIIVEIDDYAIDFRLEGSVRNVSTRPKSADSYPFLPSRIIIRLPRGLDANFE